MDAGRELDALIDTKVMGFEHMVFEQPAYHEPYPPTRIGFKRVPEYSTSIAAAWEAVERLHERDMHVTLDCLAQGPQWRCTFSPRLALSDGNYYRAEAPTAPLAICLAALKAVGVEV